MGNWSSITTGITGGGSTTDNHTHNKQNQLTAGAPAPTYDSDRRLLSRLSEGKVGVVTR